VNDYGRYGSHSADSPAQARAACDEFGHDPLVAFHDEMNRLFEDFWRHFDDNASSLPMLSTSYPRVEIWETDKEFQVHAELPGLDEKDQPRGRCRGLSSLSMRIAHVARASVTDPTRISGKAERMSASTKAAAKAQAPRSSECRSRQRNWRAL
jgi:hypothetical protein